MLKARTMMTENVVTVSESATAMEAAKLLAGKHVSSLIVTRNNKPVAIVSDNDVIKGTLNKSLGKVNVKGIMSKSFLAIGPGETYKHIMRKLKGQGIKRFLVLENDKLIGIITETDIIGATKSFTRFHQIMQEIILVVFGLVTAFFLFFFSPLGQSLRLG